MLHIHGRRFEIIAADERVLNYARERKIPLPTHTALSLRQYFKVIYTDFAPYCPYLCHFWVIR